MSTLEAICVKWCRDLRSPWSQTQPLKKLLGLLLTSLFVIARNRKGVPWSRLPVNTTEDANRSLWLAAIVHRAVYEVELWKFKSRCRSSRSYYVLGSGLSTQLAVHVTTAHKESNLSTCEGKARSFWIRGQSTSFIRGTSITKELIRRLRNTVRKL